VSARGAAGIYVHFPFCAVKCSYCDFAVAAGQDLKIPRYLAALGREFRGVQRAAVPEADTLYFGGGTPSRMSADEIRGLIDAVRAEFVLSPDAEITLEANPEDVLPSAVDGWLRAGVTRLSIGVQSLNDGVLRGAGRAYDGTRALRAVCEARERGAPSVAVDLIAGLPGEDLDRWGETISRVLDSAPDHVSLYLLETDHESAIGKALRRGRIDAFDEDAQVDAYLRSVAVLSGAGLDPYEISNFARAGHRSRHNLKYWSDRPYAGFGVGAHAYLDGARRGNRRGLAGYLADVEAGRDPLAEHDPWDRGRRAEEAVILGLRRCEGVDVDELGRRYGFDAEASYGAVFVRARADGLVRREGSTVRLTEVGRVRSNAVFREILGRPLHPRAAAPEEVQ